METDADIRNGGVGAQSCKSLRVALFYPMLLFAGAWVVWALCCPLLGDDLVAWYRANDFGADILAVPRYAWGVWNHSNARLGDMLVPVWIYFIPRPLTAVLMGCAVFAALWGMSRLAIAGRRVPLVAALTLAVCFVALPWFDMDFYVCHFNYIWGTALSCLALIPLLERRLRSGLWLWLLPLVFVAGGNHEALGFPLGCGLVVFWLCNRKTLKLNTVEKWWVTVMLAASLFCVSSPASYSRLGVATGANVSLTEYPLWRLVAETLSVVALLGLRTVWLAWKGGLRPLSHTRWVIFATAAFCSAAFCLLSGVEGRGGWYAQTFAIMALGYDFAGVEQGRPVTGLIRRMAMAVALLCSASAIFWGIHMTGEAGRRNAFLQESHAAHAMGIRFRAPEGYDPWLRASFSLAEGEPMVMGDFRYEPRSPMPAGEKNPAEPALAF